MIPAAEFLNITLSQYEDLRLRMWLNWCESKSISPNEWQLMMANAPLNRWFNDQVEKKEDEFMRDNYFSHCSDAEMQKRWKIKMTELYTLFLRPEISNIQRKVRRHQININTDLMLN